MILTPKREENHKGLKRKFNGIQVLLLPKAFKI